MILEAINQKWEIDPIIASLAGPLFAGEVPEVDEDGELTTFPYTYFWVASTGFDYLFKPQYFQHDHVCFATFCSGMAEAEAAGKAVHDLYAWKDGLTYASATVTTFLVRPLSVATVPMNRRDRDGRPVYRGDVKFIFSTNRQDAA